MRTSFLLAVLACVGLAACRPMGGAAAPGAASAPLAGTEWTLVELGGRPAPPGAEGRPGTLRLAGGRASGFAGCNHFSGSYGIQGARETALRFSALVLTRMACSTGMELERDYTAALEAVRSYRLTAQGLELRGESAVLARFVAR